MGFLTKVLSVVSRDLGLGKQLSPALAALHGPTGIGGIAGIAKQLGNLNVPAGVIGQLKGASSTLGQGNFLAQGSLSRLTMDFDKLVAALSGPGGVTGDVAALRASADRIAFVAVLQKALDKASEQQSFNLETALNDLWVSASNLRNGTATLQAAHAGASRTGAAVSPADILGSWKSFAP